MRIATCQCGRRNTTSRAWQRCNACKTRLKVGMKMRCLKCYGTTAYRDRLNCASAIYCTECGSNEVTSLEWVPEGILPVTTGASTNSPIINAQRWQAQ